MSVLFIYECGLPNSMLKCSDWPESHDFFPLKNSRPKNMPDLFYLNEDVILKNLIKGEMSTKNIMLVDLSKNTIKEDVLRCFQYAQNNSGMRIDINPDISKKFIKDKGIKAGYMSNKSMNEMINYCEEFIEVIKKKLEE